MIFSRGYHLNVTHSTRYSSIKRTPVQKRNNLGGRGLTTDPLRSRHDARTDTTRLTEGVLFGIPVTTEEGKQNE